MIRPSALGTILRSARLLIELSILKLFGQRIVWTVHNLKNHENRHLTLERWFTKRFARMASAIIAHSEAAAARIQSAFAIKDADRIHIVPHGNYIGHYPNRVSRDEAREKLGIAREAIVFLFFGRVQPYKGVLELVCEFRSSPRDFLLVIAGPTADLTLEQAIRDEIGATSNILLHSQFIPDEDVQFYMNACDALVLPYREILTSGAAMLAMSFGKACVAPKLSGMLDPLDDQGAFLYDPGQAHALCEAMRTTADKRDQLSQMGDHNFAKISNQDWAKAAATTLNIYQEVS